MTFLRCPAQSLVVPQTSLLRNVIQIMESTLMYTLTPFTAADSFCTFYKFMTSYLLASSPENTYIKTTHYIHYGRTHSGCVLLCCLSLEEVKKKCTIMLFFLLFSPLGREQNSCVTFLLVPWSAFPLGGLQM